MKATKRLLPWIHIECPLCGHAELWGISDGAVFCPVCQVRWSTEEEAAMSVFEKLIRQMDPLIRARLLARAVIKDEEKETK